MLIAGSVDAHETLNALAALRPVFHSEADFQFAFAWQIQSANRSLRVRLETRPARGAHLDLEVSNRTTGQRSAIELKYLTRRWVGEHDGERFELKSHGAQDIGGYHVVKDVRRVETFVATTPGSNGAAIVLSNDPYYWKDAKPNDTTNAAMFRLSAGEVLVGERRWGPSTGAGTLKGNDQPVTLPGGTNYDGHPTQSCPTAPPPRRSGCCSSKCPKLAPATPPSQLDTSRMGPFAAPHNQHDRVHRCNSASSRPPDRVPCSDPIRRPAA
jgi:hypothetical protein